MFLLKKYLKIIDVYVVKILMTIILMSILYSCFSRKEAAKQNTFENNRPIQNYEENIDPNSIEINLKIIEIYREPKEICGVQKTNVCLVEIVEIRKRGFGLIGNLIKGEKYLISFIGIKPTLKPGESIIAKAIETPCYNKKDISSWLFRSDGATCFGQTVPL